MSTDPVTHYELAALTDRVARVEAKIDHMANNLARYAALEQQGVGIWKVIAWVAGGAVVLLELVDKAAHLMGWVPQ